jgi:PKD domain/Bacterial Ig-like domain (group 3)
MKRRWLVSLIAAFAAFTVAVPSAAADTKTLDFSLSGGQSDIEIFEIGGFCDVCWPDGGSGTNFLGVTAAVTMDVAWTSPAKSDLEYTPSTLRQGSTLDLTNTFSTSPGPLNVDYTLAVLLGRFHSENGDPPAPTGDTTGFSVSQGDSVNCAVPLPGDSPRTCSKTTPIVIFDGDLFGVVGVVVSIPITTTFEVNGDGVVSVRSITVEGGQPIADRNLNLNGSSPQTIADNVFIPCTQPAGANVTYAMGDLGTNIGGDVQELATIHVTATIIIEIFDDDLFDPIGFPPVPFSFAMSAPGQNTTLGPILPDITPPTVSAVLRSGTMVEGSDTTFTAVADDNCGGAGLTYRWRFSDGGIAFGRIAHHTFADNGIYTAELRVTDLAGNTTTVNIDDLDPIVITNGSPGVAPPPNKAGAWGDLIHYHADAVDPGEADQPTLAFLWSFGDGTMAAGADVDHAFAMPGNYAGNVAVTDKDGGVGSAGFLTAIAKRATTLVYTGPTQSNPSKTIQLSATLSDDHGQPVVGGLVQFVLGSQNASAVTNSAGDASVSLDLKQKPDDYPLSASYAGDAKYVGSATPAMTFTIGNAK